MDRLACVDVASLPLQILLRANPAWTALPVAVVEDDRPQALVLDLNAHARRAGVQCGHRYATALTLCRHLRAGTVSPSQIELDVRTLTDRLRRFSPRIEPSSDTPGVFWLDVQGLERLYPSLHAWAEGLCADLRGAGLKATVAVGFSRFGTYALAISRRDPIVCASAVEERSRVERVPLSCLALDPDARDRLLALGIETVGDFLRLPGDGIRARFGQATDALYQLAAGTRLTPLVPAPAEEPHERSVDFDWPETNVERLVFVIKRLLDGLVAALVRQTLAVVEITLQMRLDDRTARVERVRPAAPTLEVAQLLMLVRLRLDTLRLSAGIVTMRVTAGVGPATAEQRRLYSEQTRRDDRAANQALARLRAECGEPNVVRARLCDAHLPARRFTWAPMEQVPVQSAPRVVALRPLVRRIYARALPLPSDSRLRAAARMGGPYVVSGAWWGGGVHRDYYFVHSTNGELWWLYYDRRRDRYFLQGQVE